MGIAMGLGVCSNVRAKLSALLEGLKLAQQRGLHPLLVDDCGVVVDLVCPKTSLSFFFFGGKSTLSITSTKH